MSIHVREADIRTEKAAIIDVLSQELPGWSDTSKFDWLFLDNPFGEARCWVLVDDAENIAGVSAAFPRMLRLGARELRAWVLGDFCVTKNLRSLGPAVQLQRAAFDSVGHGDVELLYDFPSRTMMAVYRRMGARHSGELVRMVYLLRAERAVAERISNPMLAGALSAAGNTLLATRASLSRRKKDILVCPREADFEDAPSRGFGVEAGVSLSRTPAYLNWRYREGPRGRPSILELSGASEGSIVVKDEGEDVEIVDLFGVQDSNVLRELILAVIEEARAKRATTVKVSVSSVHPWAAVLSNLGFQKRESAPFVAYARDGVLTAPARWFLLGGDRDLY